MASEWVPDNAVAAQRYLGYRTELCWGSKFCAHTVQITFDLEECLYGSVGDIDVSLVRAI